MDFENLLKIEFDHGFLNHNVEKVKKFQHSNFYRTKIEQKFQHFVNSTRDPQGNCTYFLRNLPSGIPLSALGKHSLDS